MVTFDINCYTYKNEVIRLNIVWYKEHLSNFRIPFSVFLKNRNARAVGLINL